jgi:DHA1 family multidrug resistance protein-like MFS transporter
MAMQAVLDRPTDLRAAKNNAAVTVASVILVDGAYFCTMPLLPDYLRKLGVHAGAPIASWTGLLMGISPAIAAAVGPWWGKVGDRTGLWLMAIRGTGVLCLAWLASALVQNVQQLLALRILLGFLGGYQTMVMALATHGGAPHDAGRIIARVQITQIATAAMAPIAGGYLSAFTGLRGMFVVSSASCLAATLLFVFGYCNVGETAAPPVRTQRHTRLSALRWMAFLLFVQAMIDRSFQPATTLWAVAHTHSAAQSARLAGLILSVGALGDGLAAWFCGRISSQPRRHVMWRSGAGSLICLLLANAVALPALLGLRLLLSILAEGGMTIIYALASRVVTESTRSSDFSLLSSCVLFGQGAGSMAAGFLAARSIAYPFYLNAALFACMLFLMHRLFLIRRISLEYRR